LRPNSSESPESRLGSVSETQLIAADKVCLLSGGLDSLIGAIDLLQTNQDRSDCASRAITIWSSKVAAEELFRHLKSQYGDRGRFITKPTEPKASRRA
jgi:hypothetical protein